MKAIGLLALVATAVSGLSLYFGSQPIPGSLNLVGCGKTGQEIKSAERRRRFQRFVGLAMFIISVLLQAVVLYRWAN